MVPYAMVCLELNHCSMASIWLQDDVSWFPMQWYAWSLNIAVRPVYGFRMMFHGSLCNGMPGA